MKKLVKKLLSVTAALSMALALCAPAMALEEYENGVVILTEDTAVAEDTDALIVVGKAGIAVKVDGAKLGAGIVVDPAAEGSEITVGGEASLGSVTVLASGAAVTVEEGAAVETLTIAATEVTAAIAGEAASVVVAEIAEGAAVVVEETAAVASVVVAAPNASAEVKGAVEAVTVAETAAGTAVTVAETAVVNRLAVEAEDVKAAIAGAVTTVEVSDTAANLVLEVAETAVVETLAASEDAMAKVEITGAGAESMPDAEAPAEPETGGAGASGSSGADGFISFQPPAAAPAPSPSPGGDDDTAAPPSDGGNDGDDDNTASAGQGVASVGKIQIDKQPNGDGTFTHLLKVQFNFDETAKKVTGYFIEWTIAGTEDGAADKHFSASRFPLGTDGNGEEIQDSRIYTVEITLENENFVDEDGNQVELGAADTFSGTYQVVLDYTVENSDGEEVTGSTKTDVFHYEESETPEDTENPGETPANPDDGDGGNLPGEGEDGGAAQTSGEGNEGDGSGEDGNPSAAPPSEDGAGTAALNDGLSVETEVPETEIENV